MAELSKFYKVTNQIMLEYVADQYVATETARSKPTEYTMYTGNDNNVYYTEEPRDKQLQYDNAQYFIKFPDESDSEYTFLGYEKKEKGYVNNNIIKDNISSYTKSHKDGTGNMHYDKIRLHFIYGFLFDKLAGLTLQVKTNARCLGPIQKHHPHSQTHLLFDDNGKPEFETEVKPVDVNGQEIKMELERLVFNYKELYLFDIFFPKECLIFDGVVKWHRTPIYQNGVFYDRYIEFDVPSAYFLSLEAAKNIKLTVPNDYGYDQDHLYEFPNGDDTKSLYAGIPENWSKRSLTYTVLPDPTVIVNFATVSEENLTATPNSYTYASTFFLDPINLIAIKYKSNSDYFNIRIMEDLENCEVIYYPVFGEGDNAVELSYDIFNRIETGEIPLITEGFYDGMDNMNDFYETYGENAYKWIIYNDMTVTYLYSSTINTLDVDTIPQASYTQHFTNIIDYGIPNPKEAGKFWRSTFIPRVPLRNNMTCTSIIIAYTCRLVNRLTSVEAIRHATLTLKNPEKYVSRRIAINNVVTYKIVNLIKKNEVNALTIYKESKDKIIRSYYDVTNVVVKDMANSNVYTQGQMTLYLKHTSSNYMFRLFNLNSDNVRIPYDLTGPYKYLLVFPTGDGSKIKLRPNADSNALNMEIGQLVFYITEDNVKRIMNVPVAERYFAIMTDTDNNDSMSSTLYEGKVAYYNS